MDVQGGGGGGQDGDEDHEGKGKPRKSVMRKTVDYNCAFLKLVEDRCVCNCSATRKRIRSIPIETLNLPKISGYGSGETGETGELCSQT